MNLQSTTPTDPDVKHSAIFVNIPLHYFTLFPLYAICVIIPSIKQAIYRQTKLKTMSGGTETHNVTSYW